MVLKWFPFFVIVEPEEETRHLPVSTPVARVCVMTRWLHAVSGDGERKSLEHLVTFEEQCMNFKRLESQKRPGKEFFHEALI
ncbi:hypothetical protein RRG08_012525 [Elysia crispata]|uniref:Uncharacterized protein n=1 Tax=Elysia crispata TaxID=231223 RepID=A0AAE1E1Z0_9GAST|nr:hypothetical protein RRG08_012525 [Elysia crispata]